MLLDARILFEPVKPPAFCKPNATLTLCCAAAIAFVYVGDGYGAKEVEGRGDKRTCFCGEIYNKQTKMSIVLAHPSHPRSVQMSEKDFQHTEFCCAHV